MLTPPANPPAGWYEVSLGPSLLRWWHGGGWGDEVVVRGRGGSDSRQTCTRILRRGRLVTTGFWILSAVWAVMAIMMSASGGYGPVWLLAPVPFIVGSGVLEMQLSRQRRLLALDAPPPIGLSPFG